MLYFGTDGIRGVANRQITPDIATRCGNALAQLGAKKVVVGRDTRQSGDMLVCSLAGGCLSGGADVIDVGILPTPGVAYLTQKYQCDFGVVVSASHNPPEYNGIKIFAADGTKLGDKDEQKVEQLMACTLLANSSKIGQLQRMDGAKDYCDFLISTAKTRLDGLVVALDCSNGATSKTAQTVFERLGAKVYVFCNATDGRGINVGCGSLNPQFLAKKVVDIGADVGFCFDGDGDRLIAIDECGKVVDGDKILYVLAKTFCDDGILEGNLVVGTSHTNLGIEKALQKLGIRLLRADVGDKYVSGMMRTKNAWLGGEQSGHVIVRRFLGTGDGVLVAMQLAGLVLRQKMSHLADVEVYPQANVDVIVEDKMLVINNEGLWHTVACLGEGLDGRILVRASGTEPKVRVMVECQSQKAGQNIVNNIAEVVKKIEG